MSTSFRYLALGDSYTIGEQVIITKCFPMQVVQQLRSRFSEGQYLFTAPEIVAKTGFTTDELLEEMQGYKFLPSYDFVSLLIGVNNQYRGRDIEEYAMQFEQLLRQAIGFAGDNTRRVVVLSIPDWGVTPFASGRNKEQIATEIDGYNAAAGKACEKFGVEFIDITSSQRLDGADAAFLAADGLHPSGKEYEKWAKAVVEYFEGLV
jgi:lysophospholipase L1-like esterase